MSCMEGGGPGVHLAPLLKNWGGGGVEGGHSPLDPPVLTPMHISVGTRCTISRYGELYSLTLYSQSFELHAHPI